MKLSKLYLALCCGLPVVANAEAVQADENNKNQLDEISVIALRDASSYAKYAYRTSGVNQKDLSTQQATSVADALRYLPNVDVQGGSRAVNQKPIVRGLTGNRVVQIVDGVRQNFDLAHRGSYFTPTNLIQEIEVIKGPSSTIWGSGALGGTVVMRTANALDLLKPGQSIGAKIEQGYQSANSLSSSNVAVYGANQQFDWLIQGYYNDADNLRTGSGDDVDHSAYRQQGGLAKLGWQINNANRVELSHRYGKTYFTAPSNNDAESELTYDELNSYIRSWHASNTMAKYNYNYQSFMAAMTSFYSGLTSKLGSVSYLSDQEITDQNTALNYYFNPENPYINAQFTLYHNRTVEEEKRVASGLQDRTKLTTTGFNLRNSSDFSWLNLTYGVDYYQDHATTKRGTNSTDGLYRPDPYDAKSKVTGVYLLGHIPLGERVILSPSIRYDHFKTNNDTGSKYSDHHWSPSLALTWKATNWLDLTAKYNEAFRAPSLQERFTTGTHFSVGSRVTNTFVANPDLRPEVAKNKEVSADFHFDNVFADQDKLRFVATYFQNDVKDLINLETYGGTSMTLGIPTKSQYQNISNARLRGFELETQYQLDRLTLGLAYAQTRGKDKDTNEALANIAANKASFVVNYELVKDKFNVGASVVRYSPQRRVPDGYSTYDGYTLTNLMASFAPKSGEWSSLSLNFAVENLFDRKNQPAFSLMEDAGRNVKVSLGYKF